MEGLNQNDSVHCKQWLCWQEWLPYQSIPPVMLSQLSGKSEAAWVEKNG